MSAVIRRVVLVADTLTPVSKPGGSAYQQVSVLNGTGAVLFIYSGDTPVEDVDNFVKVANGMERLIRFQAARSNDIIFYLKSASGGDVALVWG